MMTGILIATPLAACAQDNTASDISAPPQPVATKMVADAGRSAPIVPVRTGGEAQAYKIASTPQPVAMTTTPAPDQEVWVEAQDHSKENVEVAIVIYGRNKNYTVEQLGAGYQKMFKNKGVIETSVWTALPDKYGAGVMFLVDGSLTSEDFLNVKEAAQHVPEAADMFKEHAPIMRKRLAAKSKQTSLGDGNTAMFADLSQD